MITLNLADVVSSILDKCEILILACVAGKRVKVSKQKNQPLFDEVLKSAELASR